MKWDLLNITGEKLREVDLPEAVYDVPMNEGVLHLVTKAYRANRRQGTHAVKTRGNVSGGGKKPFKQKGTGNARQGSSRSPLMAGGGTVHGPEPRDYRQGLNKKTRRLALRVALSDKARHKKLILVDDFGVSEYRTKLIAGVLANLGVSGQKALLADERKDDFLMRSARNLHKANAVLSSEINAEHVLAHEFLILSESALQALGHRFGGLE